MIDFLLIFSSNKVTGGGGKFFLSLLFPRVPRNERRGVSALAPPTRSSCRTRTTGWLFVD